VLGHDGFNLGLVGGVGNEELEITLHLGLGQVVHTIELGPELVLKRLSGLGVELNGIESHGAHNTHGGLEALIVLHVVELARASHDVQVEAWGGVHANELAESGSVVLVDLTSINKGSEEHVE